MATLNYYFALVIVTAVCPLLFREKGYKKVFLLTITAQIIARHVYETHGFYKVFGQDKSEWGDGVVEER